MLSPIQTSVRPSGAASLRRAVPDPTAQQERDWADFPEHPVPLVWTHASGRKSLVLSSTAVRIADHGPFARAVLTALQRSDYFAVVRETADEAEAARLLQRGEVQFVINLPEDFSRRLLRGERLPDLDSHAPIWTNRPAETSARYPGPGRSRAGQGNPFSHAGRPFPP